MTLEQLRKSTAAMSGVRRAAVIEFWHGRFGEKLAVWLLAAATLSLQLTALAHQPPTEARGVVGRAYNSDRSRRHEARVTAHGEEARGVEAALKTMPDLADKLALAGVRQPRHNRGPQRVDVVNRPRVQPHAGGAPDRLGSLPFLEQVYSQGDYQIYRVR